MTRFVGEAIAHRKGKGSDNSGKDRAKKMETFLASGSHADVESAQRLREGRIPDLPEHDINRSFVFMDLAVAGKPLCECSPSCMAAWCLVPFLPLCPLSPINCHLCHVLCLPASRQAGH
jgi:hypothetical protein